MKHLLSVLRRTITLLARLCTVLLFAAVAVCTVTYLVIYAHFDGTAELPADCALVFGAAVYGQSQPGPAITRRVAAAAQLYRDGQVHTLILSGGKGRGVRESEADVMRAFAMELGVPARDILTEDQSHSTQENIAHSRNLTTQCSSVIGVSDQYHLARIELLSWRQGWGELQTYPAQDRPPVRSEQRSVLREVFALLYYGLYADALLELP